MSRGTVGKTAVDGAKDRKTNKILRSSRNAKTLREASLIADGAMVYTDDAAAYKCPSPHGDLSVGEYLGWIESFWSTSSAQGYHHKISPSICSVSLTNLPVATVYANAIGPNASGCFRDGREASRYKNLVA